jgi:hypothetical protein
VHNSQRTSSRVGMHLSSRKWRGPKCQGAIRTQMTMTPPEWIQVANERAADAQALQPHRGQSTGPVYMAGYAVECALKAYLVRNGIPFPSGGSGGHDLRGLWARSGFRLFDIKDSTGAKSFYLQSWSTDLRYQVAYDSGITTAELVNGACALMSWLMTQTRRGRRR